MYLFNCEKTGEESRKILLEMLSDFKCKLDHENYPKMGGINSSFSFYSEESRTSILSEFPGNCSSLVLSKIEWNSVFGQYNGQSSEDMLFEIENRINFAISFGKRFGYALLWITGVRAGFREFLVEKYGAQVVLENVYNPHSGKKNWFVIINLLDD